MDWGNGLCTRDHQCVGGPRCLRGMLTVFALGGYGYCLFLVGCHATVQNALNATWAMVIFALLEAASNLGFSLALIGPLGIGEVSLGTFFGALTTSFWIGPLYLRHRTEGKVRLYPQRILIHAVAILLPALVATYFLNSYGPSGWKGIIVKTMMIVLYLAFSWRILSLDLRHLIRSISKELLIRPKGSKLMGL